jgi:hypothetical protein
MSFVIINPQTLAAAAGNMQDIGLTMAANNAAAAGPTTGLVPAAADPVSGLTAAQFASHAEMYQAISAQAEAIHQQLVATMGSNASSYAAAEAANTTTAG